MPKTGGGGSRGKELVLVARLPLEDKLADGAQRVGKGLRLRLLLRGSSGGAAGGKGAAKASARVARALCDYLPPCRRCGLGSAAPANTAGVPPSPKAPRGARLDGALRLGQLAVHLLLLGQDLRLAGHLLLAKLVLDLLLRRMGWGEGATVGAGQGAGGPPAAGGRARWSKPAFGEALGQAGAPEAGLEVRSQGVIKDRTSTNHNVLRTRALKTCRTR